ncbi:MAG: right-handed parallel beta-helix repeat-containing protein [Patescibacteria group bacterium]
MHRTKRFLILGIVLAGLFAPHFAFADTNIEGEIASDTTWTKSGGPYVLSGDVYVPAGVTLNIEAGAKVYFEDSTILLVEGDIKAIGSANDPVIFDGSIGMPWNQWRLYISHSHHSEISYAELYHFNSVALSDSDLVSDHMTISEGVGDISLRSGSTINARSLHASEMPEGALNLYDHSSGTVTDFVFETSLDDSNNAIGLYTGSTLNLSNFEVDGWDPAQVIGVYEGHLNIDGAMIADGGGIYGIIIFDDNIDGTHHSSASLKNVTIKNFFWENIVIDSAGDYSIEDSDIEDSGYGIDVYSQAGTGSMLMKNNIIMGNGVGAGFYLSNASSTYVFDARDNWWGDASGPYNADSNPEGLGNILDDDPNPALYSPWLTSPPHKRNPVIIIPGIMSSYLNKEDGTEVWPNIIKLVLLPFDNYYLKPLMLDEGGKPTESLLATDVIRDSFGKEFFAGLINNLISSGYKEGKDMFVFPYDWRLDVRDNVEALKDKIDNVLKQTKSNKVDVIAHSMGGLVAKYYIEHEGQGRVDKFVDIATPHFGAPKAFKALEYGDDMEIKFNDKFGVNPEAIKRISQNMPSVYNLLPSREYFAASDTDYKYYVDDIGDVDGDGASGRLDFESTEAFLKNTGRNDLLLGKADNLHQDLDEFDPANYGVDAYNIVGCGTPTIGKIFANKKQTKNDFEYEILYISGDGTVPQRSAEGLLTSHTFYANGGVQHSTMPSDANVDALIDNVLAGSADSFDLASHTSIQTASTSCALPNGKYLSFHSPVDVHVFDAAGDHTGPDSDGNIEYGVPGVAYDTIGEQKFVFLPDGAEYSVKLNATANGAFSVNVKDYEDGQVTDVAHFDDLPIIGGVSKAEVRAQNDAPIILLDENGDGDLRTINPSSDAAEIPSAPDPASEPITNMTHFGGRGGGVAYIPAAPAGSVLGASTTIYSQKLGVHKAIKITASSSKDKSDKIKPAAKLIEALSDHNYLDGLFNKVYTWIYNLFK